MGWDSVGLLVQGPDVNDIGENAFALLADVAGALISLYTA